MEPEQATTDEPKPEATQSFTEAQDPEPSPTEEEAKPKPSLSRTKVRCTDPANGPDIAMGESGLAAEDPITIPEMFKATVSKIPEHPALRFKTSEDTWSEYSYQEYYDLTVAAAKSFLKVSYTG